MRFDELGLAPEILRAITEEGYTNPTPIQAQAIPIVLSGKDLMGGAQTGTGKTAAFTLPLLQRILPFASPSPSPARHPVRILMLAPTRELAIQVHESVKTYSKYVPIRSLCAYGGVDIKPQIEEIRAGIEVLVATPGRLLDLVEQKCLIIGSVQALVLDEADRMLDMGFIHDIRRVLKLLPQKRQNLLFSATFADEIRELATGLLNDPLSIEVAPRNSTAERIEQLVHPVDKANKPALLAHLVAKNNWEQVLVFTRTKHIANRLAERLEREGIQAAAIHGNKSQGARTKALAGFKSGEVRVLVATDIAARGLDIDKLPQVVNFELPNVAEDYVHRIGRTGRAGSAGHAISLVSADEGKLLRGIERLIKQELPREVIAGFEPDAQTMRAIEQGTGQPVRKGQEQDGRPPRQNAGRPGQARRPGQPASGNRRPGNGGGQPAANGANRGGKPSTEGGRRAAPQRAPDRHANQAVKPHGNK